MFNGLQQKLFGLSKVAGAEFVLLPEGKLLINIAVISLNNNRIKVEHTARGIEDIKKIGEFVPADVPLVISVTGRGVIHRKVSGAGNESNTDLLNLVLPNSKEQDFYLQKFYQDAQLFISVLRKEVLDNILKEINDTGNKVINIFLGPYVLSSCIHLFQINDHILVLKGNSVVWEGNKIAEVKSGAEQVDKQYKVGDQQIYLTEIIAFSSAFTVLLGSDFNGLEDAHIASGREEFRQMKLFKAGGASFLIIVFIGLLFNYLFYQNLKEENSKLSSEVMRYEGAIKETRELESRVKEKESFLKTAGWLELPKTSYYADDIASFVPYSVNLTELKINPLNQKLSKNNKKLYFSPDTLLLSGSCSSPVVLNPWIDEFKSKVWIEEIRNTGYVHDYKNKSGQFKFEAKLKHDN